MGDQVPLEQQIRVLKARLEHRVRLEIIASEAKVAALKMQDSLLFYNEELAARLEASIALRDAVKAFIEAMGDGDELQIAEFNGMVDALHRLEQP